MQSLRASVRVGGVVGALMVGAMTLTGCTSQQRPVDVALENHSTAPLEVQVDLPARGPLGRKANHEAYRTLLGPGESWRNSRDTLRFGTEPNTTKGFRVWVADLSEGDRLWHQPFEVTGSRRSMRVVFEGQPGSLTYDAGAGQQPLVPE